MVISWLGLSCFRLQMKSGNTDVVLVTDPFDPGKTGLRLPRNLGADIVTASSLDALHGHTSVVSGSGDGKPFVVNGPGEYEVKGVFVTGISSGAQTRTTFYRITAEDMRVVHLGALTVPPTAEEIDRLGDVDVLLVPVAGTGGFGAKEMASVVSSIEPRVVIPMHYETPGLTISLPKPDAFLKELGSSKVAPEEKVRLLRKELPEGEMRVIVLKTGG